MSKQQEASRAAIHHQRQMKVGDMVERTYGDSWSNYGEGQRPRGLIIADNGNVYTIQVMWLNGFVENFLRKYLKVISESKNLLTFS